MPAMMMYLLVMTRLDDVLVSDDQTRYYGLWSLLYSKLGIYMMISSTIDDGWFTFSTLLS